jgi:protein-S-isoprenylcysteine O-methyltransferase Ste14
MRMLPTSNITSKTFVALDLAERTILVVLFGMMSWVFLRAWLETGDGISLMLLVSEGSVLVFVLIRRWAQDVSWRPADWLIAFAGTTVPLLARPTNVESPIPIVVCVLPMLVGFTLQIAAKLALARSFGLVAANRGVKVGGPYRIVRHPMYAGYLLTQIGFLLANPSTWNASVYTLAFCFQIRRIVAEELLLARDPAYRVFAIAVPHRLFPGVF